MQSFISSGAQQTAGRPDAQRSTVSVRSVNGGQLFTSLLVADKNGDVFSLGAADNAKIYSINLGRTLILTFTHW